MKTGVTEYKESEVLQQLHLGYEKAYRNSPEELFFSPGRVNLIGEHIDYTGGEVMPFAIGLGLYALVKRREDMLVRVASSEEEGYLLCDLDNLNQFEKDAGWGNYVNGMLHEVVRQYPETRGADIYIYSTLPRGSGLSSSAALEALLAVIFEPHRSTVLSDKRRVALAGLTQKVENEFVGVACGIMDQFAVLMGEKDRVLKLNTATLEYELLPFDTGEYVVVILNSNKPRKLSDSAYNERRSECDRALQLIQQKQENITHLTMASEESLQHIDDATLKKRARHAITEMKRVLHTSAALKSKDLATVGTLLNESHFSLRDNYQVTGKELDALTACAREHEACLGARMTGAGFGGCAIALVQRKHVAEFASKVQKCYSDATGLNVGIFITAPEQHSRRLREKLDEPPLQE